MTIQEMTANFDLLAHAYYFGAIAYIAFLFYCHLIDVLKALKADYRSKSIIGVEASSQAPLGLPSSSLMTLRELRNHIRVHNLQAQVRSVVGRSVSHCSKDELIKALA